MNTREHTMYHIIFETSTDIHSLERRSTKCAANMLSQKIADIQVRGYIIYSVNKI